MNFCYIVLCMFNTAIFNTNKTKDEQIDISFKENEV